MEKEELLVRKLRDFKTGIESFMSLLSEEEREEILQGRYDTEHLLETELKIHRATRPS